MSFSYIEFNPLTQTSKDPALHWMSKQFLGGNKAVYSNFSVIF